MKLREYNVFSRVCLSTGRGSHVTIAHDALDFTIQGPPCTGCHPQCRAPAPLGMFKVSQLGSHCTGCHPLYRASHTCSNLFNLDIAVQPPLPGHVLKLVHYEARTSDWHSTGIISCFFIVVRLDPGRHSLCSVRQLFQQQLFIDIVVSFHIWRIWFQEFFAYNCRPSWWCRKFSAWIAGNYSTNLWVPI